MNRRTFFRRTALALAAVSAPAALLAAPDKPYSRAAEQFNIDREAWIGWVDFYVGDVHYKFIPTNPTKCGKTEIIVDSGTPFVLIDGNPFDCTIIKTTLTK